MSDFTPRDLEMINLGMRIAFQMIENSKLPEKDLNQTRLDLKKIGAKSQNLMRHAAADARWHVARWYIDFSLKRRDPSRPYQDVDFSGLQDLLKSVGHGFADEYPQLEDIGMRDPFFPEFSKLTDKRLETYRRYLRKRYDGMSPEEARREVETWSRFSP